MKEVINFMYFANNFSQTQLEQVFNQTNNPNHLKSKFNGLKYKFKGNGTQMFLDWFMMLDRDNQNKVSLWIENNYKGIN